MQKSLQIFSSATQGANDTAFLSLSSVQRAPLYYLQGYMVLVRATGQKNSPVASSETSSGCSHPLHHIRHP